MTTLANLLDKVGDDVRDTTNISQTNLRKVRAINKTLQELSALANFSFAKKSKLFTNIVDGDYTGLSIEDGVGVSDFKDPDDVRLEDNHTREFTLVHPDEFAVFAGSNRLSSGKYTVEELNGSKILRVAKVEGGNMVIDPLDSYNPSIGTWTAGGGTSSIATDTDVKKRGSGSVSFTLSTAGSAFLEKTYSTTQNLTTRVGVSSHRLFLYIPSGLTVSSVDLRWGDSASVYWNAAVTAQYDGSPLVNGWNRLDIPWKEDTTKTGSPDSGEVAYYRLTFAYTASASVANVRIDDMRNILGTPMNLSYFTGKFVKTSASDTDWQLGFSTDTVNTSELLLAPDEFSAALVEGCNWQTLANLKGMDSKEVQIRERRYELLKKELLRRWAIKPKRGMGAIKIQNYYN